ncbi:MAG: methyltransferase domain-containing protein [Candidatus Omnitrophica bacterium]|nr:methyltransferase domain-containing protein [Candidatus Omnitrophota bacterium]
MRYLASAVLRPRGKINFIKKLPFGAKVLDVGCGNNSPYVTKALRPDLYYVGLDIGDYNQQDDSLKSADQYIVTKPNDFVKEIQGLKGQFDALISAHNLEHCLAPEDVLIAMLRSLKEGGLLFLSFPCEASVHFPKRAGTLNFYDDATHLALPNYNKILKMISQEGFDIQFCTPGYRPFFLSLTGFLLEPLSALTKRVVRPLGVTWAFYGFESIIWAQRRQDILLK